MPLMIRWSKILNGSTLENNISVKDPRMREIKIADATDKMVSRVVRTVEYNTGNSESEATSAIRICIHLCANSFSPVEVVNQAIAANTYRRTKRTAPR